MQKSRLHRGSSSQCRHPDQYCEVSTREVIHTDAQAFGDFSQEDEQIRQEFSVVHNFKVRSSAALKSPVKSAAWVDTRTPR
jgi:hypothetical protein